MHCSVCFWVASNGRWQSGVLEVPGDVELSLHVWKGGGGLVCGLCGVWVCERIIEGGPLRRFTDLLLHFYAAYMGVVGGCMWLFIVLLLDRAGDGRTVGMLEFYCSAVAQQGSGQASLFD